MCVILLILLIIWNINGNNINDMCINEIINY